MNTVFAKNSIDYKFATFAFQVDYSMPWGTLTVIPTYSYDRRSDITNLVVGDDTFFGGSLMSTVDAEDQKTGEVRLTSPAASRIKWEQWRDLQRHHRVQRLGRRRH